MIVLLCLLVRVGPGDSFWPLTRDGSHVRPLGTNQLFTRLQDSFPSAKVINSIPDNGYASRRGPQVRQLVDLPPPPTPVTYQWIYRITNKPVLFKPLRLLGYFVTIAYQASTDLYTPVWIYTGRVWEQGKHPGKFTFDNYPDDS